MLNKFELIYYKVGQSLLPTGASITKKGNFITNWGKIITTKGSFALLQSGTGSLFQFGAILITKWDTDITKWGNYCKVGQFKKSLVENWWTNAFIYFELIYYRVGQSLLQTGASITKWGNYIANSNNYYKVGQALLGNGAASPNYKTGQQLLQIEASNLLQSGAIVFGAKVGQYTFVTIAGMETHIYWQGQCGLRVEFVLGIRLDRARYL